MRVQRCVSPIQAVVGLSPETNNNNKVVKNNNINNKPNECQQVVMYMERLQHLVPNCPKDKPINKLDLIQRVIDYIYDLEYVLNSSTSEDETSSDEEAISKNS